jgi:hypothetical protein
MIIRGRITLLLQTTGCWLDSQDMLSAINFHAEKTSDNIEVANN